jgi:hypothetical protein
MLGEEVSLSANGKIPRSPTASIESRQGVDAAWTARIHVQSSRPAGAPGRTQCSAIDRAFAVCPAKIEEILFPDLADATRAFGAALLLRRAQVDTSDLRERILGLLRELEAADALEGRDPRRRSEGDCHRLPKANETKALHASAARCRGAGS